MAKTKTPKNPRAMHAVFRTFQNASIAATQFNPATGEFHLIDDAGKRIDIDVSQVGISATSRGGQRIKPLSQIPARGVSSLDMNAAAKAYDSILAVDVTPILEQPGRHIAAAAEISLDAGDQPLQPIRIWDVVGLDPSIEPEQFGWYLMCETLLASPRYTTELKVLLVTDAHLGKHEGVNRRTIEPLPGWVLPPGIDLTYASERSPSDSLLQAAINLCDTVGNKYAASVRSPSPPTPNRVSKRDCTGVGTWVPKGPWQYGLWMSEAVGPWAEQVWKIH